MMMKKYVLFTAMLLCLFAGAMSYAETGSLTDRVKNPALPVADRIRALEKYTRSPEGKKDPMAIVAIGEQLLTGQLTPDEFEALVCRLLLPHVTRTVKRQDLAEKYHRAVLAHPQADVQYKIEAVKNLCSYLAQRNDYDAAFQLAKDALSIEDIDPKQVVQLYKVHVNLLKWQGKHGEAETFLRSRINEQNKKEMLIALAELHSYFRDWDKAHTVYLEAGLPRKALAVYESADHVKARAFALKVLADEQNYDEPFRGSLLYLFLGPDQEDTAIRKKYAHLMKYAASAQHWRVMFSLQGAAIARDYDRMFEILNALKAHKNYAFSEDIARVLLIYALETRRFDTLTALKAEIAASRLNKKTTLLIAADCFLSIKEDKSGAFKEFCKNYKFPEMTQQERADLYLALASFALNGGMNTVSAEIHKAYLDLYKHLPCKTYTIPFSDEPVIGLHGFLSLKKMPDPHFMDRKFGGSMDFLSTDVSTGERSGAVRSKAKDGEPYRPSELRMICDQYGIHILFRAFDSKAKAIEAGLAGAGSFEMYLAPGEDQPYYCPLPDTGNRAVQIWNTTYNTPQWRRLDVHGKTNFDVRTETVFADDGYYVYLFLAWDKFYDKLPEKGDLWDFENIHWSRFGGHSWNGIKTIHGRSSWGKLAFEISDDQMRRIKRNLIAKARKAYLQEKRTTHTYHGEVDRWAKDLYAGDPDFYKAKVAPLIRQLDSYLPLVTVEMDDATVDKLFHEAVPGWFEIRFKVSDLRKDYLEESLFQ